MRIVGLDGTPLGQRSVFDRFAKLSGLALGHPYAFAAALALILLWAATGPIFHYSDTWQLVINTGTTVITFLMVFLIQNSQNRDSAAIQLKLDELIRAGYGHNALVNLEDQTLQDIRELKAQYQKLAGTARVAVREGRCDTDSPDVRLK